MSKYRIIKSIATNKKEPYFIQSWDEQALTWRPVTTWTVYHSAYETPLCCRTLERAKKEIKKRKQIEHIKATPAKVVWEEEDE